MPSLEAPGLSALASPGRPTYGGARAPGRAAPPAAGFCGLLAFGEFSAEQQGDTSAPQATEWEWKRARTLLAGR